MMATAAIDRGFSTCSPNQMVPRVERFERLAIQERRKLADVLEVEIGLAGFQIGLFERPPSRGKGCDTSGVPSQNVVDRVADKDRVFRSAVEAVQCYLYGFGIGLVSGGGIAPDHSVHEPGEADVGQAAHSQRFGFAGYDAKLVAACGQHRDRVYDIIVAADQPIVICELILAI